MSSTTLSHRPVIPFALAGGGVHTPCVLAPSGRSRIPPGGALNCSIWAIYLATSPRPNQSLHYTKPSAIIGARLTRPDAGDLLELDKVTDDNPARTAACELVNNSVATARLTSDQSERTNDVLRHGRRFFDQTAAIKESCVAADRNSGFRTIGEEYSQTPDRPDLNESYSAWGFTRPVAARADQSLCTAILRWQTGLEPFVANVLREVRQLLTETNTQAPMFAFRDSSYAQLNSYTAQQQRDSLQDAHEDGHAVTLLVADGPGLEVSVSENGPFIPVPPDDQNLIVMAGSALTAVTGDRIPPLYHRVRNFQLPHRFSLMYFVNPDVSKPLYGWFDSEESTDLAPAIASKPGDFGLPPVPR